MKLVSIGRTVLEDRNPIGKEAKPFADSFPVSTVSACTVANQQLDE